jgi:hypothetical protein
MEPEDIALAGCFSMRTVRPRLARSSRGCPSLADRIFFDLSIGLIAGLLGKLLETLLF